MSYLIIGNGTAAVGCIEGIRTVDKTGPITVLSAEDHKAYCRPLISYLLEDKTTVKKMDYRAEDFYEINGCRLLGGVCASGIDAQGHTVTTVGGEVLSYDKLCVATGSSPFVPSIEGMDSVTHRFNFLTLDDAVAIKAAVTKNSRVFILGGGLIGLKCAEGLRSITDDITVCDLSAHILSSILDGEDAQIVERHLTSHGIRLCLHQSVVRFDGDQAVLQDGTVIPFDVLITAVGVRPNVDIIRKAGGICGRGITINEKSETSLADIYAAGDCTECRDFSDGQTRVMALMPNAYWQGFTAGVNMAGGKRVFDHVIPMNSAGFFGLHLMTAGHRGGRTVEAGTADTVRRFFFEGNRMVGYVLIGDVANAGIYTGFIRNGIPFDRIDGEMLKSSPDLTLFDADARHHILGSVV